MEYICTTSRCRCRKSLSCICLVSSISNSNDTATWQRMAAIKSNILRRMDTASPGVRICCIKFVQQVIQTQTPGLITDPRVCMGHNHTIRGQWLTWTQRPDRNEISLALVPRDHPLIPPTNLEAEASGLLDRLLSLLEENNRSEARVRWM